MRAYYISVARPFNVISQLNLDRHLPVRPKAIRNTNLHFDLHSMGSLLVTGRVGRVGRYSIQHKVK